jgi:anti-anti-sigma regulatory factor
MKTIWNVIAALALINIIALAGVIVWLKTSDRLNADRARAVKETFKKTIAEETAAKAAAEAEATVKAVEAAQASKMAQPPESASEKIEDQKFREDQRLQVLLRQQQELENLRSSLMSQIAKLEDREKRLDADRKAFADERRKVMETDGNKQFLVALSTLEGQKPKDAKSVLKALLDQHETDQVVAYLAKMEETKRSKVIAEFVKDDASMAADLLERLRTRGVIVPAQPSTAQVSANDPASSARTNGALQPGR